MYRSTYAYIYVYIYIYMYTLYVEIWFATATVLYSVHARVCFGDNPSCSVMNSKVG